MNEKIRQQLFRSYGGKCHICGRIIEGENFDVDHLTPRLLGGTDDLTNLAPAHPRCNRVKQAVASHVDVGKQFALSPALAGKKETVPSQVRDFEDICCNWLVAEIDADRNESDLPTRFHYWLVNRLNISMTFSESMRLFLSCCEPTGIKAKTNSAGKFLYGIFEVLPLPQYAPKTAKTGP